jgi:hypothetical protein
MADRKIIQDTFIRVAQDSNFEMDPYEVAKFTAGLLKISPFQIAFAFSDLKLMEQVAKGEHPASKKNG